MGKDRSLDMIKQFVLAPVPGTSDVVRGHVFGSEPDPSRKSAFWEDMHRTFEVEIILSGRARHMIGEVAFSSEPGDVVLIPAWEPHGIVNDVSGRRAHTLVIQFLPEFLGSRTIGGLLWLTFFAMPAAERPKVSPMFRHRVLGVAENIRYEIEEMPFGWEDGVRAELLKVFLILARSSPFDPDQALDVRHRQSKLERVMPAVTLVYSEPSTRHTLEEAADACRLGARHFSSQFKQVMGVTFAEFSLRVRLKRAAELLSLTDLPVETIAEQTGFTDHSHLSRSFACTFGSTPTNYRRSLRRT